MVRRNPEKKEMALRRQNARMCEYRATRRAERQGYPIVKYFYAGLADRASRVYMSSGGNEVGPEQEADGSGSRSHTSGYASPLRAEIEQPDAAVKQGVQNRQVQIEAEPSHEG